MKLNDRYFAEIECPNSNTLENDFKDNRSAYIPPSNKETDKFEIMVYLNNQEQFKFYIEDIPFDQVNVYKDEIEKTVARLRGKINDS